MPLGFGKNKRDRDEKVGISRNVSILKSRSNANEAIHLHPPLTPMRRARSVEGLLEGEHNKEGRSPDLPLVRIFLSDESYRAVRPTPGLTCEDVVESLWPKANLPGKSEEYGLYVVYTLAEPRFVQGNEPVEGLNTNPWDSVVKIYLRHKDDVSDPEEFIDREGQQSIVLPRARSNTTITGRITANPYATATGDFSRKKQQYNWSSKFQNKFKNAWSLGSQLAVDEPLPDSSDDEHLFRKGAKVSSSFPQFDDTISDERYDNIEQADSCYGTLRPRMYTTVGTFDHPKEPDPVLRVRSQSVPLMDDNKQPVDDDGTFSTFGCPLALDQLDSLPQGMGGFRESGISEFSVSSHSSSSNSTASSPPAVPIPNRDQSSQSSRSSVVTVPDLQFTLRSSDSSTFGNSRPPSRTPSFAGSISSGFSGWFDGSFSRRRTGSTASRNAPHVPAPPKRTATPCPSLPARGDSLKEPSPPLRSVYSGVTDGSSGGNVSARSPPPPPMSVSMADSRGMSHIPSPPPPPPPVALPNSKPSAPPPVATKPRGSRSSSVSSKGEVAMPQITEGSNYGIPPPPPPPPPLPSSDKSAPVTKQNSIKSKISRLSSLSLKGPLSPPHLPIAMPKVPEGVSSSKGVDDGETAHIPLPPPPPPPPPAMAALRTKSSPEASPVSLKSRISRLSSLKGPFSSSHLPLAMPKVTEGSSNEEATHISSPPATAPVTAVSANPKISRLSSFSAKGDSSTPQPVLVMLPVLSKAKTGSGSLEATQESPHPPAVSQLNSKMDSSTAPAAHAPPPPPPPPPPPIPLLSSKVTPVPPPVLSKPKGSRSSSLSIKGESVSLPQPPIPSTISSNNGHSAQGLPPPPPPPSAALKPKVAHPPSSSVKESTSPPSLASVLHASVTSSPASLASVLRASITSPPALTPVVHNSTTSPEGSGRGGVHAPPPPPPPPPPLSVHSSKPPSTEAQPKMSRAPSLVKKGPLPPPPVHSTVAVPPTPPVSSKPNLSSKKRTSHSSSSPLMPPVPAGSAPPPPPPPPPLPPLSLPKNSQALTVATAPPVSSQSRVSRTPSLLAKKGPLPPLPVHLTVAVPPTPPVTSKPNLSCKRTSHSLSPPIVPPVPSGSAQLPPPPPPSSLPMNSHRSPPAATGTPLPPPVRTGSGCIPPPPPPPPLPGKK